MQLEEFAEGNSILHRLDPRIKFLTLLPFIIVIALMKGLKGPFLGFCFSIILVIIGKLNFKKLLDRMLIVNAFVFFLWLCLPFSYPGNKFFHIGPLTATKEGILYTLSITFKTNGIVLATIAILGTSNIFSLAHALIHLKIPNKLIYLFFFCYRYITVFYEEYTKLKNAMVIKCFKPRTDIHTYRSYAYLVGMLLIRSYERSKRIYNAMLCRSFQGKFPLISHFRFSSSDLIFAITMVITVVTLLLI